MLSAKFYSSEESHTSPAAMDKLTFTFEERPARDSLLLRLGEVNPDALDSLIVRLGSQVVDVKVTDF